MKRIDLGRGALALEPTGSAERVDAVPDDFFTRNKLSEEAVLLYEHYRSFVSGARPRPAPKRSAGGSDAE